ncbi:MAG TPA: histidine kinase [Dongiaceae bacterium]|nr:histidine kinase [Dongiaceae bacterium]
MSRKPVPTAKTLRRRAETELRALARDTAHRPMMAKLARGVAARLREPPKPVPTRASADTRTVHELQVHQIELEMQNVELQEARERMELVLEKYTDLYDFAPVGYFSLDKAGGILEANLTGAALLGIERSRLIGRLLTDFVVPANRLIFLTFLQRIFARPGKQICEVALAKAGGGNLQAGFTGSFARFSQAPREWCRVAVSDITVLKQAEAAQRRIAVLAASNRKLEREIARRRRMEQTLKQSEQHQRRLLADSRRMHGQLQKLTRLVLQAQEEERKAISRELHDVIAQTLTGISIRLATLKHEATASTRGLARNITRTQQLVQKSVDIVHQFARELRPAVLDDLGLIPALHSFMTAFAARTGLRTHLTAFAGVEGLAPAQRTVLFRVAQEALTNVARHAQASRVEVSIRQQAPGICMTITDDGKSFHVQRVLLSRGNKHLGLLGMRERLEMIGGHFEVVSIPGRGTAITAQIPSGPPVRKKGGGPPRSPNPDHK